METFQAQSKLDLTMSYRAVGSSTGQKEFIGQSSNGWVAYNDFGAGDIPMSSSRFGDLTTAGRKMVHVPFCLGAIAIFHSIPAGEVGNDGLKLSACLMSKIFSGQITIWDHPDVKAENPSLQVPTGTPIIVGHRTLGSSSTGGTSGYMNKKCPSVWTLGASSKITWPTSPGFKAVEGSPGMTELIQNTKYAIGYLDAGHGHGRNFQEVKLRNLDGTWITSKESLDRVDANGNNGVSAAGAAGVAAGVVPADVTADWSAVNLYDQGGTNTWPIVLVSYIYVSKDLSAMSSDKAGLLKAFVDYVTGSKGQGWLADFSFQPVPSAMNKWTASWALITKPAGGLTAFQFETSTTPWDGQGSNMISVKRNSYSLWKLNELDLKVQSLEGSLAALHDHLNDNGIVPLHGSGTTNPKNWFAKGMKIMEHRARVPLMMTYRAVGSSTGQKEFLGQAGQGSLSFKSYNHFGAGDIPMSNSRYAQLPAGEEMVHMPFALGAIGIFHSVPEGEIGAANLNLDACLLAKIFGGKITTWDHADIKAQNPGLKVPAGQMIQIGHRRLGSSSTGGTTGYLNKKCPSEWTLGAGSTVNWPTSSGYNIVEGSPGMQKLLETKPYALGYLDAGHGHDVGFLEVALTNKAGTTQTSKESIGKGGVASAGEEAVQNGIFPSDHTSDWSAVNLYDMSGTYTWPIVLVSYFYVKKDQTATNPKTAAALHAFVKMVLDDKDGLCTEFGFTCSSAMKIKSLAALGTVVFPASMVPFTLESSTDPYNGMHESVISVKRHAYDDYHRGVIEKRLAKLESYIAAEGGLPPAPSGGSPSPPPPVAVSAPSPPTSSAAVVHEKYEDDDTLALVGLIVAILAVVMSGVAMFMAKSGGGGGYMKDSSGTVIGNRS